MDVSVITDMDVRVEDEFILAAVIRRAPQPKLDDPTFDKIDFSKLPNVDSDEPPQFIIEQVEENDSIVNVKFEKYENNQVEFVAQKHITLKKAYEYLFKLSESYDIIDVEGNIIITPANFKQNLIKQLGKIAEAVPEILSWAIEKSNPTKEEIVSILNKVNDAKITTLFLDNPDVIKIIGRDAAKELRKNIITLAPREYRELQMQASVLKEIGGEPDKILGEISRGTVHDHVIANILSGSISTFGLYNVMKAIESAPKNVGGQLERRNWSILRNMSEDDKISLARIIYIHNNNDIVTFVNALDLVLRVLSNPNDQSITSLNFYDQTPGRLLTPKKLITDNKLLLYYVYISLDPDSEYMNTFDTFRDYMLANYTIPLPGLEKLVNEIEEMGINEWINEKLPNVTQFSRI